MNNGLDKIFNRTKRIYIDDNTKVVIMSDCHRGTGDNYDNFVKNKNIFLKALDYYYKNGFTYVELGDGDEMWEVKNYNCIVDNHLDVFKKLREFYNSNRLIMIYGNHDIYKKRSKIMENSFYKYYDKKSKTKKTLLDGLIVYESLIFNYKNHDIFLIHGHQVNFLNSKLWCFSKFFVRYIWKKAEYIGIKDPTKIAKNYEITKKTEKRLNEWSIKNNKILIAGHTHRPMFPMVGKSLYFNDGCCIHPDGITCLEIESGRITLVKWEFYINEDNLISVRRKVLEGNESIIRFFK